MRVERIEFTLWLVTVFIAHIQCSGRETSWNALTMRNIYVIVLLIVTRKQFACYANKLHVHPHLLVTTARTILRNLSSEPRSLDGIVFCSEERVWSALRLSVLGIGCGCWERGSVLATVEPLLSPWGEHQASGRRAGRRCSGASMCGALFRRGAAVRSTSRARIPGVWRRDAQVRQCVQVRSVCGGVDEWSVEWRACGVRRVAARPQWRGQ